MKAKSRRGSPTASEGGAPSSAPKPVPILATQVEEETPTEVASVASVSTATQKIQEVTRDFLDSAIPGQIKNRLTSLRADILLDIFEEQAGFRDEMLGHLSTQTDRSLGIVKAEARTRVQTAIDGMRDKLMQEVTEMVKTEVPPMVRMGVETLPGLINARQLHEDIKALTQSLQEEKSRVQVLEGRLNLCMMGTIEGPSETEGRTSPKGTRSKYSRQAKAKARRRKYGGVSDSAAEEDDESDNPSRKGKKSRQGSRHKKSSFRGDSNHRHGRGYADDEEDDEDSPSDSSGGRL